MIAIALTVYDNTASTDSQADSVNFYRGNAMGSLDDVKIAAKRRMQAHSAETLESTKQKAVACIHELHAKGSTVQQVTIRRDHVTIDIDPPDDWLTGTIHVSRVNGRYRETVKVTSFHGCQVQWVEQKPHPFLQPHDA